jgi:hypothetical protein
MKTYAKGETQIVNEFFELLDMENKKDIFAKAFTRENLPSHNLKFMAAFKENFQTFIKGQSPTSYMRTAFDWSSANVSEKEWERIDRAWQNTLTSVLPKMFLAFLDETGDTERFLNDFLEYEELENVEEIELEKKRKIVLSRLKEHYGNDTDYLRRTGDFIYGVIEPRQGEENQHYSVIKNAWLSRIMHEN